MAPIVNQQGQVCEMCGDEGYKQCLITCTSCGAHQHMYCMKEVMMDVPQEWYCDDCQNKTQDLLAGKGVQGSLDFGPAKYCSWIGRFIIHHDGFMNLECSLKAHVPPIIKKKIWKMSLKMPEEIQLTMVARTTLGINMLPTSPTKHDIGLFFFCGEDLGCRRYIQTLERLDANDWVMRSCINGKELIILSSTLLPPGSQYWLGRPFMWAVLRSLKKYKNISELNAIVVQPDPISVNDMDIEMCGSSSRVNGMDIEMCGSSSRVGTNTFLPPPLRPHPPIAMNYGAPPGFNAPPGFDAPPGFEKVKEEQLG